ncbi:hypothetical protein AAVH_08030 [Aphelenchoides avenae]|nr:hypothetical protein AAVH_08030 [Aphelenchus avenae]
MIETEEMLETLKRTLEAKDKEILRLSRSEQEESMKRANAELEVQTLKESLEQAHSNTKNLQAKKVQQRSSGDEYQSVVEKYVTWHNFAQKQLEVMKQILIDCGQWTEDNRYKLFFAYREIRPMTLSHDDVLKLSEGSVLGYNGIEDIESISETPWAPKLRFAATQTDPVVEAIVVSADASFSGSILDADADRPSVSANELRCLDLSERVSQLENENAMLYDQLTIAKDKARQSMVLEEQKADLQNQLNVNQKQTAKILLELQQLKDSVDSQHLAQFYGWFEANEAVKAGVKRRRQDSDEGKEEQESTSSADAANLQKYLETTPQITGYHVAENDEGDWEVTSELRDDCQFLLRKNAESGRLEILETESLEQWQDVMDQYAELQHAIPLFLAAVTLSSQDDGDAMDDDDDNVMDEEDDSLEIVE